MINKWEAVRRLLVTAQNFEFMQEETAITDINVILDEYAEHLKSEVSGGRNSTNNAPLHGVNDLLVDFQHYLVLDGALDIDEDEIKRNAEVYSTNRR